MVVGNTQFYKKIMDLMGTPVVDSLTGYRGFITGYRINIDGIEEVRVTSSDSKVIIDCWLQDRRLQKAPKEIIKPAQKAEAKKEKMVFDEALRDPAVKKPGRGRPKKTAA